MIIYILGAVIGGTLFGLCTIAIVISRKFLSTKRAGKSSLTCSAVKFFKVFFMRFKLEVSCRG